MSQSEKFESEKLISINEMAKDEKLQELTRNWFNQSCKHKYSYNFKWMGRPIIQYPQDMIAIQEIIWDQKPDFIVETGIAHGGSLIFSASLLEVIGSGKVIGVDIDIREHNRLAIEEHKLSKRIHMIQGSSIDKEIFKKVRNEVPEGSNVLVVLDSNHTHQHVYEELLLYSQLVPIGGYLIVLDTVIEWMSEDFFQDRPWRPGNSPMSAVDQFLKTDKRFKIDEHYDNKLLISVGPRGYLKRVN